MAKPISTHPNYKTAKYETMTQYFDEKVREIPQKFITWPIYYKKFWIDGEGNDLSHCLTLPKQYATIPPESDLNLTAWKTNSVTDEQLTKYYNDQIKEAQDKGINISQIQIEGGSELIGFVPKQGPQVKWPDDPTEPASTLNTWIQLLDLDLVMLRLTYTRFGDWALNQLFRAPFWKRGYLQYLDLQHNLEVLEEFDKTFSYPENKTNKEEKELCNLTMELTPYYENLKFLGIRQCKIGENAMRELVVSPLVQNLVHLDLTGSLWCNTEQDQTHFAQCQFTCLKILNLSMSNLMDQSFENLMGWVGHTLQYFYCQGNHAPLTLKKELWQKARAQNQERFGENKCYRNLKIIDFGNIPNVDVNLLDTILEYCQTQNMIEFRFSNTGNITGQNIFCKSRGKNWDNLVLLEMGNSLNPEVVKFSPMQTQPIALYDIFYNSNAGQLDQDDVREISIGERVKCITWPYSSIGNQTESGQIENNQLAYLVYAQYYAHQRVQEAKRIIMSLNGKIDISNINLTHLFSPAFFVPPKFDSKTQYDLEFDQYTNPIF